MSVIGRAPTTGAAKHWTSPRVDNLTLMSVAHQGKWCPSRVRNSNSLMTISPTILDAKYIWFGNIQCFLYANSTNLNSSNIFSMRIQLTWIPTEMLNANSINLNSSINSQLNWNNSKDDHPNRIDLLIQNSRLDTHVEDSHHVEHSVDPAVVYRYYLVYD